MDQTSAPLTNPLIPGRFTRVLLELRWGDMDAYGHVNNVTQLRLLEEARVRAFGSPTASRDAANIEVPGAGTVILGEGLPDVLGRASADTGRPCRIARAPSRSTASSPASAPSP